MGRNPEMHRWTANEERPEDEQARSHCLKEAKHARPTEQMAACNQESKAAAELRRVHPDKKRATPPPSSEKMAD